MTDSVDRQLIRILYFSAFSESFPITEPAQDAEVAQILHASVKNNRTNGITGFLLVHQGSFIQALEGPRTAVIATYQRIAADQRHKGITMIAIGNATRRSFSKWNMCAGRLSDIDDAVLQTLDLKDGFKPQYLLPDTALRLLSIVAATISGRRLDRQTSVPEPREMKPAM